MEYKITVKIDAPVDRVFEFCASSYGFEKYFPYRIRWISKQEKWDSGSVIEFEFRFFLTWIYWKAEITAYESRFSLQIL